MAYKKWGSGVAAATRKAEYEEYLRSDHWHDLREKSFAIYGHKCLICGDGQVDGHHLVYRGLTDVKPEEVIPLCRRHHDTVHQCEGSGQWGVKYKHKSPNEKRRVILKMLGASPKTPSETKPADYPPKKHGKKKGQKARRLKRLERKILSQHRSCPTLDGGNKECVSWIDRFRVEQQ